MWSKQAENRGNKHVNAKSSNNSSKNASKSQRKRKNNAEKKNEKNNECIHNHTSPQQQQQASNKKYAKQGHKSAPPIKSSAKESERDECDFAKSVSHAPDLIEDLKRTDEGESKTPDEVVVLRKKSDDAKNTANDSLKRYSDSFVNDNSVITNGESESKFMLSRTHSGFFLLNASPESKEKKRRFSDIFRHSLGKSTSTDEPTKITQFAINENGKVVPIMDVSDNKAENNTAKRTDAKSKPKVIKSDKDFVKPTTPLLKRVRSRIYKTKTESYVSSVPSMPDISETKERKSKKHSSTATKTNTLQEPTKRPSHFDFRLLRQSSNLEYVRPRSMLGTQKKSTMIDNPVILNQDEKPTLAKSKSSSAINLNLLRSRRKPMDSKKQLTTKQVEDEFDFLMFDNNYKNNKVALLNQNFGSQDFIHNINNNVLVSTPQRRTSWVPAMMSTETKPGNPVARTPSDRRPDAVREESKNHDVLTHSHDMDNDNTPTESSVSLPASTTGNKQRQNSHINRSESVKEHTEKNRKQKRNVSDPLQTSDAYMLLEHHSSFQQHSGSSSNSSSHSISSENRFSNAEDDSDLDVEPDPPDWTRILTEETLASLHPKQKAKQDVINELFHTERTHVRNLKVLDKLFRKDIAEAKVLSEAEQRLVFANLPEVLLLHTQFNVVMKKLRSENEVVFDIGDLLLSMFDGEMGNRFGSSVAYFCQKQQLGLELITDKRKKDSKFESVLNNCEKSNLCRRLQLQGLIPQEMQRTTKYKLLIERLIEIEEDLTRLQPSGVKAGELDNLKLALEKIKLILARVNEAAKIAYNEYRLEEIRKHTDFSAMYDAAKGLEWTLVREGMVMLKRQNKTVSLQMLLLQEAVILLHKEGDRFVLKHFHVTGSNTQTAISPIIKISNLICRPNAADMTCLYLLSTAQNGGHMYEIQCPDETERRSWFKYLTEASEPYKDGRNKRAERSHDHDEEASPEMSNSRSENNERIEPMIENDLASTSNGSNRNTMPHEDDVVRNITPHEDDVVEKTISSTHSENDLSETAIHTAGEGSTVKLSANDWTLIQPSEVQVAETSVHTAEPVLSPLEKIKRKDEEVKKALSDKGVLVADLLNIPHESYHVIADMISLEAEKKMEVEACDLVLASLHQVDELVSAVNDSYNIGESDAVLGTGGKHSSCASNETQLKQCLVPSVPAFKIQSVVTNLMTYLRTLLHAAKQKDEECEKLRIEVHKLREQLHEQCNVHTPSFYDAQESEDLLQQATQSGDLESIEESPTETETT